MGAYKLAFNDDIIVNACIESPAISKQDAPSKRKAPHRAVWLHAAAHVSALSRDSVEIVCSPSTTLFSTTMHHAFEST
jgi:hypothetical protein